MQSEEAIEIDRAAGDVAQRCGIAIDGRIA
jgi:hypothetical protein